jgi:hypothetical protein
VWKQRERAWGCVNAAETHGTRLAWTSVHDGKNGRRVTAAAMRYGYRRGEAFEGYDSAGGEPALVRNRAARPDGRRDPAKPSEPQVRNRAETCADPEVGGNRRGGGKPRGRNTKSWCGNHGPRDRCFGTVPGVDDRGQRRRRGVPRRIPGEEGSTGPARDTGSPLPIGSAGHGAKARRRHDGSVIEPSGALQDHATFGTRGWDRPRSCHR